MMKWEEVGKIQSHVPAQKWPSGFGCLSVWFSDPLLTAGFWQILSIDLLKNKSQWSISRWAAKMQKYHCCKSYIQNLGTTGCQKSQGKLSISFFHTQRNFFLEAGIISSPSKLENTYPRCIWCITLFLAKIWDAKFIIHVSTSFLCFNPTSSSLFWWQAKITTVTTDKGKL